MSGLPNGTVTFLFSDIEGSTRLLRALAGSYTELLAEQRRLIGQAVEKEGGIVFGSEGDALFAAFSSPTAALRAAAVAQRSLAGHPWPGDAQVRVRIGVHTGEASLFGARDYIGLALHEVSRVMTAAHGGQVLVSGATRQLVAGGLDDLSLIDLGSHRLKDLAETMRLFQLAGAGLPREFAPPRTLDRAPNNLPVPPTPFVERSDLAAARAALERARLLTLTGPGGTGKTRLALQLAAVVLADHPDGAWFVALEAVEDSALVPSAIGTVIGLNPTADRSPLQALGDHLRERRVLLVLDNFEQVVDAGPMVAQLVREAAGLRVIVTSRIVLHVSGERELPVAALSLPPAPSDRGTASLDAGTVHKSEAVRLFVERAQAVRADFVLDDANAATVAEIVRRLDGLPLAIELAAARLRVLPLESIRGRLDQQLALLTGGARDLPARQQTLRGAIDWSYEMLEPQERTLFERFSVFAGGAFLAEAERVCRPAHGLTLDVLDGLSALVDKSLLRAVPTTHAEPRFAMLATIREYASGCLARGGAEAEARDRHLDAYMAVVDDCADALIQAQGPTAQDRLEADHDNLRAALDCCIERADTATALRLVAGLWRFWQARGHLHEGRRWIDRALAMPGVDEQPARLRIRAFGAAGGVAYWQGDFPVACRHYVAQLEAAREADDPPSIAEAMYNLGFAALPQPAVNQYERFRAGKPWFEAALAAYTELGDDIGIANAEWGLALSAASHDDLEQARAHALRALDGYRRRGDISGTGWAAHMLALYNLGLRRLDEALDFALQSVATFVEARDVSGRLLGAYDVALIIREMGYREPSLRMSAAVHRLVLATGVGVIGEGFESVKWGMPEEPADEQDRAIWSEGSGWTIEELVSYAQQVGSTARTAE
jgi:predicted ATPase/class 3 adenylate cyclase